jgi:hypothetical protein
LYNNGYTKAVTNLLDEMNISHFTFFDVAPDPTLACAKLGAEAMREFKPDVIIAVGGGSAMDAGKIVFASVFTEKQSDRTCLSVAVCACDMDGIYDHGCSSAWNLSDTYVSVCECTYRHGQFHGLYQISERL